MSCLKYIFIMLAIAIISACSDNSSLSSSDRSTAPKFANLSTISSVEAGEGIKAAVVSNNNLFFTNWTDGLGMMDLSDPTCLTKSLTPIAPFGGTSDSTYGLVITGNIAVISATNGFDGMFNRVIRLYDISDLKKPIYLSTINMPSDHVIAEGNMLYVSSSNFSTVTNFFAIIDISNPFLPVVVSSTNMSDSGYITKKDNIIYVSNIFYYDLDAYKYLKIQTIDVTNPSTPIFETKTSDWSFNQIYSPIIINGNIFYYFDVYGLNVVNIDDRQHPLFVKTIPISTTNNNSFVTTSLSINNNKLYIAALNQGVMVFDISQPSNPKYLKSMKSNTDALSVSVSNGVGIYITDVIIRQYDSGGYSIIKGNMINLFYDK